MSRRLLLAVLGSLAVQFAAPMVPAIAGAAGNGALDRIVKAGVVRVAVPDNFPPFGELGPDAKPQGYDIDTAALVATALGVKLALVQVVSAERIPSLTAGKVDLVISSLGKDAEREKAIDFSVAYAPFFSGVFGPRDLAISKPEDLAGKTIAVTSGTIEDAALTKVAPATATIKRYDDNAATEVAFLGGQAELVATASVVAAQALAKSPLRKTNVKFLLHNSPCYVGIAKGEPDLKARVDAIITAARQDGRLDAIAQRWLKAPIGDPEHPIAGSVQ